MKICNKCKREMEENNFYKDKTKKDGLSTCCKDCRKEWKANNKEHITEYNHAYGQENKEAARNRKNKNRNERIEHYRELRRNWAKENPEKSAEYRKRDYEKHSDGYKMRALKNRQRRKNQGLFNFSCKIWEQILDEFNHECAYCGSIGGHGKRERLQAEHVVPIVLGGTYEKSNIVPACRNCNLSKHDKPLEEWYPKQPFYNEEKMKRIINRFSANQR